jgi:hypothetical protein
MTAKRERTMRRGHAGPRVCGDQEVICLREPCAAMVRHTIGIGIGVGRSPRV